MEQRTRMSVFLVQQYKHAWVWRTKVIWAGGLFLSIASLVGASCTTQHQLQHDIEVLALQRVGWGRSSHKSWTGESSKQGFRVPSISGWGTVGGCRCVGLVQAWDSEEIRHVQGSMALDQAWDSDEEVSVHRGCQDHRQTAGAWTSGVGLAMISQSHAKLAAWQQTAEKG